MYEEENPETEAFVVDIFALLWIFSHTQLRLLSLSRSLSLCVSDFVIRAKLARAVSLMHIILMIYI